MGCKNGKPVLVLTDADLDFIANNTSISREDVQKHHDSFIAEHSDGKITKSDFKRMMEACFPGADSGKLQSHIFRMYDTNDDGHIDFREFMIVLYVLSNGSPEDNLKQLFRIFDIDSDGAVSPKELERIVKALFHLFKKPDDPDKAEQEQMARDAFKEMDTNDDGRVTKEEFVKACMAQETISKLLALKVIDVFI